ncbi:uncharacterized protein N0V96_001381 [Colletotrichum fioriniae]|uniref:uncharacterized protein n=1 Tax=Colletotrichum fioriniae TaxID=710243 RepID=UPI0032DA61B9|nr:hypothetical protein N0V96_001381 [Colletotrichum fioriniae]
MSIKSDLNSKLWTEIQCPECRELLEYVDIQKYADGETFARHNVTWHENLSCQEYDALLHDPENFRSRIEMEYDEFDSARQAQEDADRAMAQGLMAEQQAEIQQNEARERAERERARKAVALARKVAARRKAEEEQSRVTVSRTTKPCPGCGWAIEKNSGW